MSKIRRKPIPKQIRESVWKKYGCRCAYCGCELEYKDMQIDHVKSVYKAEFDDNITDSELSRAENLMPSCRMCNYYKNVGDIGQFRERLLGTLKETAISSFQTRLAIKYGMVIVKDWDGKFWFEKFESQKK